MYRSFSQRIFVMTVSLGLLINTIGCDPNKSQKTKQQKHKLSKKLQDMDIKLPGTGKLPNELQKKLKKRLDQQIQSDSEMKQLPEHTNRLLLESSPYLRQHAHNPVNWYPWGDKAFKKARKYGKPILLSVGYSTCHWCHVMKRKSFEDKEIAEYMNLHYIPIKVDREERPDINDAYMNAVRLFNRGNGGWPMTVFLTPEKEPYFAGTYFPPDRFKELLKRMKKLYVNKKDRVQKKAQAATDRIAKQMEGDKHGENIPAFKKAANQGFKAAKRAFDDKNGGFGRRQKFPHPTRLQFLLRYHQHSGKDKALEMVTKTLEEMANEGIYDHLAGGFHRYATDPQWRVPHFEKMLYDNVQLATTYTEAWQATGNNDFAETVEETLTYLERDMSNDAGALYSATNADSLSPENGEKEEGAFFVWSKKEIEKLLPAGEAKAIIEYYNVTQSGNFEGENIFYIDKPKKDVAESLEISTTELEKRLKRARTKLFEHRDSRPHPHRDEKIVAAWNGLGIEAFAKAGLTFGKDKWIEKAESIASFLMENLKGPNDNLHRTYIDGQLGPKGYASDYALSIAGLISLFEATGETRWLQRAEKLQKQMDEFYWDDKNYAYFQTADGEQPPIARKKPRRDGSLPSANSYAATNLLKLYHLTLDKSYKKRAEKIFKYFQDDVTRRSLSITKLMSALYFYDGKPLEIAIVEPSSDSPNKLRRVYRQKFLPNSVFVQQTDSQIGKSQKIIPWLEKKKSKKNSTTGFVCRDFTCKFPTTKPEKFKSQIESFLEDRPSD